MLDDIGGELARCDLLYSFRSAQPILALVDAVFRGPAAQGLAGPVTHHPIDPGAPGRVELWPFLAKPAKRGRAALGRAARHARARRPGRAARRPASPREIAGWLADGRALPGAGRPRRSAPATC